ncbi:MAG TPA: vitamin K epoxide reductase family protein [Acidimicrobiales bacterium]
MPTLRWQPVTSLVLSIYGLGASIYLTITHFEPKALACVSNSRFNCEKVTQSPQSEIFGIPVAMLGLAFFVPMLLLCLPAAWRAADRRIHLARLVLSVTGVGMIIYLISAELFVIKAICLWCSSVHVATLLLFIIIATTSPIVLAPDYGAPDPPPADGDES